MIAREHGFTSWPTLKLKVEARRARRPVKTPSPLRLRADALVASLIVDAAAGDPKLLADRTGVCRGVIEVVRDMLEARRADRSLVLATCLKGLAHDNPGVRFECAHALDSFGDASCRGPLVKLIDDPMPRVRWMAMHALSCDGCKDQPFGNDDELRSKITARVLTDTSVQVRRHAVLALGIWGGASAVATLEVIMAHETDIAVLRRYLRG